jgi:serine/alanine adding enzyme
MKYEFKSNIDKTEYKKLIEKFPAVAFSQYPEWADVKDNWGKSLCGLFDENGNIVAGALLLIRKLPLGRSIIYSPRGFILDYSDKEVLTAFTDGIKAFAKSVKAISVKIDPFVPNEKKEDLDGNIYPLADFGNSFEDTINNLKELGYKHHGYGKELGDYFQPRFNMAIPLFDENGATDEKKLLKTFSKGARSYIGNYQKNRGVFFETVGVDSDLSEFVRLLSFTEKRQNIHLRNEEYFKKILKAYGDNAKIYYAKIDLDVYAQYLQKSIDKGENAEKNQKLLDDVVRVKGERGQIISLSTGLVIFPKKDAKLKVAEYLYAGTDTTIFPNLCTPNGIVYKSACDSLNMGCDYYNLGGVDGDLKSPLAIFKLKFAPHILEYVGEFDLVINKFFYFGFEKCLPLIKKAIKKIKGKK